MEVYLDNAATTPLSLDMRLYLYDVLSKYGNPSSVYSLGNETKNIISASRENVASFINCNFDEVIFTSGGSASNNLAIKGYIDKNNIYNKYNYVKTYYSPIMHTSALKSLSGDLEKLKINNKGEIDIDFLEDRLKYEHTMYKPFVVIDYANSEIGTIQNVKEIINITHKYNGIIYIDCTGSISTIPIDVKELDVDMIGFSAHKIGGLKGVGVLYKKNNIKISPLICGNQESGLFGGTENVLGITSIGKAIEDYNYDYISSKSRDYVYDFITTQITDCYLIGSENRLLNNLYICFQNVNGEVLLHLLDDYKIQVSTGSACNNYEKTPSNTLKEIGIPSTDIYNCIRFSFNCKETTEQLDYVNERLKQNIKRIREMNL